MADLRSNAEETSSRALGPSMTVKGESVDQQSSSSRSRRKLGRSGSRSWFNKSFDQNILQQPTKPAQPRAIRRQKSVTDFFQNVLSKSKSHLQDIFVTKKEKSKHKAMAVGDLGKNMAAIDVKSNGYDVKGAEGGWHQNHCQGLHPNMRHSSLYNSCPSLFKKEDFLTPRLALKPRGSLNKDCKTRSREKHRFTDITNLVAPTDLSASSNMFTVAGQRTHIIPHIEPGVDCSSEHRPVVKQPSLQSSTSSYETLKLKLKSSTSSLVFPKEGKLIESPNLRYNNNKHCTPTPVMLSPLGFSWNTEDANVAIRQVSSAPPNRQRVCSTTDLLPQNDPISKTKRALVKSNSDSFTQRLRLSESMVKASSENAQCFNPNMKTSLTSSMPFLNNIMASVTDYLFLGSVEAAYNERLLCKYNISSLIDMTNLSPSLVPPNKKSDCPCTCVNNTHFRSKLNIGVDDIEWENVEQYFDEINAFIHGARKKGKCVLVFSYLGRSRAPTAAIQHLMQYFKLSYKTSLGIVQAKRPETRLNSGFVKALLRLEQREGLHGCGMADGGPMDSKNAEYMHRGFNGSVDSKNEEYMHRGFNGSVDSKDEEYMHRSFNGSVDSKDEKYMHRSFNGSVDSKDEKYMHRGFNGSVEVVEVLAVPPVVRGAWLEC